MVTFETERQEAKLLGNYSQDQIKDHYKESAEADAKEHNVNIEEQN